MIMWRFTIRFFGLELSFGIRPGTRRCGGPNPASPDKSKRSGQSCGRTFTKAQGRSLIMWPRMSMYVALVPRSFGCSPPPQSRREQSSLYETACHDPSLP